jgi:hypothetical protein
MLGSVDSTNNNSFLESFVASEDKYPWYLIALVIGIILLIILILIILAFKALA